MSNLGFEQASPAKCGARARQGWRPYVLEKLVERKWLLGGENSAT